MALGVVAIIGTMVNRMITNSFKGLQSSEIRQEILNLRKQLAENVDCKVSLNITTTTSLPLTCPTTPITLLNERGNPVLPAGNYGKWTVKIGCGLEGLKVGISRPGKDPLTKQDYEELTYNGRLIKDDIFGGMTNLCAKYFEKETPSVAGQSPGGKCMTYTEPLRRNELALNVASYRGKTFACPDAYPLGISVNTIPSCSADNWQAGFASSSGQSYNSGVACSLIFLEDNPAFNQQQKDDAIEWCAQIGGDWRTAYCNYTCCDL